MLLSTDFVLRRTHWRGNVSKIVEIVACFLSTSLDSPDTRFTRRFPHALGLLTLFKKHFETRLDVEETGDVIQNLSRAYETQLVSAEDLR